MTCKNTSKEWKQVVPKTLMLYNVCQRARSTVGMTSTLLICAPTKTLRWKDVNCLGTTSQPNGVLRYSTFHGISNWKVSRRTKRSTRAVLAFVVDGKTGAKSKRCITVTLSIKLEKSLAIAAEQKGRTAVCRVNEYMCGQPNLPTLFLGRVQIWREDWISETAAKIIQRYGELATWRTTAKLPWIKYCQECH